MVKTACKLLLVVGVLLVPGLAWAQSSIAGVVKDARGRCFLV